MEFSRNMSSEMKKLIHTCILILIVTLEGYSQSDSLTTNFDWKGQVSIWSNYNENSTFPLLIGGRYIPQANYEVNYPNQSKLDFEASLNLYGNGGFTFKDSSEFDHDIKPYRFWARYSTHQFELRVGLQKINFGSAAMLRPLMWFDQIDPRDPLQLTDGVYGLLARYYFLNNANIWLWGLYGNTKTKGWETFETTDFQPEFGGRVQLPIPRGEIALSAHHRKVNTDKLIVPQEFRYNKIKENRIGFDAKVDLLIGLWTEVAWVNKATDFGLLTNQEFVNVGTDYTFGIGNGLSVTLEHLLVATDEKPFEFKQTTGFSALNVTYPLGLFDDISAIVYYDWKNNNTYNFINWKKQFRNLSLYVMGYANPKSYNIPLQEGGQDYFIGTGMQVMVVYNY